jgi:hypothetical protein
MASTSPRPAPLDIGRCRRPERCVDPLREAVDYPERLAYIHRMFKAYQAFAAGV